MLTLTQAVETFPSVRIPSHGGGLPVEVSLISQMDIGSGNTLIAGAMARQRGHETYIDHTISPPSLRVWWPSARGPAAPAPGLLGDRCGACACDIEG